MLSEGRGFWRDEEFCSLLLAGELQKSESHYLVSKRMQILCLECSECSTQNVLL